MEAKESLPFGNGYSSKSAVVCLEMFFFKGVLCCSSFSAILLLKEKKKTQPTSPVHPRVVFFFCCFCFQFFHIFFRNSFFSLL